MSNLLMAVPEKFPNAAKLNELLGENACLRSWESSRAYLRVGTKDEGMIFANFALEAGCDHSSGEHRPVVILACRFLQSGGSSKLFFPSFHKRGDGPQGAFRLDKLMFPLADLMEPKDLRKIWDEKNVPALIVGWVKEKLEECKATPVSDEAIAEIAKLAFPEEKVQQEFLLNFTEMQSAHGVDAPKLPDAPKLTVVPSLPKDDDGLSDAPDFDEDEADEDEDEEGEDEEFPSEEDDGLKDADE